MERDYNNFFSDSDLIINTVKSYFIIKEYHINDKNLIQFKIELIEKLKEKFTKFSSELKSKGFIAYLRKINDDIFLLIGRERVQTRYSKKKPLILLLIVIGVVFIDGWWRSFDFINKYHMPYDTTFLTFTYVLALLGIVGIHELGHMIASFKHGIKSSFPYFIPGIPGYLPTFGAAIITNEPPLNRDALFDLGFSGPIAGLIVTLIVTVPAALTSIVTSYELPNIIQSGIFTTNPSLLMMSIFKLMGIVPNGTLIILSPLGFAAWIGFLITFLNILPAWQLDGGHIIRAVVGRKRHRITTYLSIFILLVLGFWLLAFLILFLSIDKIDMSPLDDVNSISKGRKILFIVTIILIILLIPFPFL